MSSKTSVVTITTYLSTSEVIWHCMDDMHDSNTLFMLLYMSVAIVLNILLQYKLYIIYYYDAKLLNDSVKSKNAVLLSVARESPVG